MISYPEILNQMQAISEKLHLCFIHMQSNSSSHCCCLTEHGTASLTQAMQQLSGCEFAMNIANKQPSYESCLANPSNIGLKFFVSYLW